MLAQINSVRGVLFVLMAALLLSGCTPAGPRALLKGKKYLDRGDVAEAVTQFKRATTLLATNASAWNYYGVALQRAGQADDAAAAYQYALKLDHDLLEAHYNLGLLWLEQNRPDAARTEFTTYTLRRPNEAVGWLKLGFAQLRAGDTLPAQRSFSTVRALKGNEAEAYNGLGLASVQLGKPRDAAQFFTAALQASPDFAPALQNLATVNQQYLHDNKAALANYQAYLMLTPRPANYSEVKTLVATLEQSDVAATVMAPAVIIKTSTPPPPEVKPKAAVVTAPHPPPAGRIETPDAVSRTETPEPVASRVPVRPTVSTREPRETTTLVVPTQTVRVQPSQPIVAAPRTNPPSHPQVVVTTRQPVTNAATTESVEVPMPEEQPRAGFWHRLFNVGKTNNSAKRFREDTSEPTAEPAPTAATAVTPTITVTPAPPPAPAVPTSSEEIAGTKPEEEKPAETKAAPPPAPVILRYTYTSPPKPAAGDRRSAEGAFTKARLAEQDESWPDAEQWYQSAADIDPAWFEAQYNTGVIAHRLKNYSIALPRYEQALAIQPDSVDARYNFALALKASGYPADSADELRKILAANPDEVRAHLALANLCAQSLHNVAEARQHYVRVLDLQPNNPQAADIRFWLSANSK